MTDLAPNKSTDLTALASRLDDGSEADMHYGLSAHERRVIAVLLRAGAVDRRLLSEAPMNDDQIKAVADMAEAFRAVLPIMKAVRYSVGLGANQLARIAKAEATLAEYDRQVKP